MRYLIQENILPGGNLIDKFKCAKRLGLDGIELTIFGAPWLDERLDDIAKAADASGMAPMVLCGGYRGWLGHFDDALRSNAVNDISRSLEYCRLLGVKALIAPAAFGMHSDCLPPFASRRTREEDNKILIEGLLRISEAAEKHEVVMFLEPLNRYEDHMVNTLGQAVDIIKSVGSPYVKIMGDLFHMSIEEGDIAGSLKKFGQHIAHIHLADSNRMQPGKGHTDFGRIFASLDKIGFSGFCAFECGFQGINREADIKESLDFLKNLELQNQS